MKIILVPCAATEWREEGRLMGRVALDPAQKETIPAGWLDQLRAEQVGQVLHAPDDLSARTAKALARELGVPRRKIPALDEVDVGLWAGLTDDDLRARYESCYRRLYEAPLDVTPPGGENLADAADRIRKALDRRVSRNGLAAVAVVLRPLALSLARSVLRPETESEDIWELAHSINGPVVLDVAADVAAGH